MGLSFGVCNSPVSNRLWNPVSWKLKSSTRNFYHENWGPQLRSGIAKIRDKNFFNKQWVHSFEKIRVFPCPLFFSTNTPLISVDFGVQTGVRYLIWTSLATIDSATDCGYFEQMISSEFCFIGTTTVLYVGIEVHALIHEDKGHLLWRPCIDK